jgi:hypothetical protein
MVSIRPSFDHSLSEILNVLDVRKDLSSFQLACYGRSVNCSLCRISRKFMPPYYTNRGYITSSHKYYKVPPVTSASDQDHQLLSFESCPSFLWTLTSMVVCINYFFMIKTEGEVVDIYGDADDFSEVVTSELQELQETVLDVLPELSESVESTVASASDSKPILPQSTTNSLPAKPMIATASNLSYSAHVAKQFSAYRQTPSQERQQRMDGGALSSSKPRINAPRNAAGPVGDASSSMKAGGAVPALDDTVFGKKPSEMHDAG